MHNLEMADLLYLHFDFEKILIRQKQLMRNANLQELAMIVFEIMVILFLLCSVCCYRCLPSLPCPIMHVLGNLTISGRGLEWLGGSIRKIVDRVME